MLEIRLKVRATFKPSFLPEVAQLASMASSSSARIAVKDEVSSPDWDAGRQEDASMEEPDVRACGVVSEGMRFDRATALIDSIDSEFREYFASLTIAGAKDYFLTDPADFRQASMLQFLYKSGPKAFEEMHLDQADDRARDDRSKASGARASGEQHDASNARASGEQFQHNQHKRKNAQALFSSAS